MAEAPDMTNRPDTIVPEPINPELLRLVEAMVVADVERDSATVCILSGCTLEAESKRMPL